jgi:hypothetical protein
LKKALDDNALGVLDDLPPETRPKMWQKFDIEGIVHKEFVPPGQTVNGKFCWEVLRRLRSKHPAQTSRQLVQQTLGPALLHASLVMQQFLASRNTTVTRHPPYSPDLALCDFPIPEDEIEAQGAKF